MLIAFTSLPGCVTMVLRGMLTVWRGRHRLIFCWLLCMQAVSPGRQTLAERARWTPATRTAWRLGRGRWWAQALVATLPAPAHGLLSLGGDGRHADQRGPKPPGAQQGRRSQPHPWGVGLRFGLVRAAGASARLPVGLRRRRPKRHAGYRSANGVCRALVGAVAPPSWAQLVIVGGEAAEGSKATMARGQDRDTADTARRRGLGWAIARTWKTVEEKTLKPLVTHVPPQDDQGTRVPRAPGRKGRRTFGTDHTRLGVRPGGDVPVVLRPKGRNVGPHPTKRLGTQLAELPPSHVVGIYQKRGAIARMHWERQSGLGWGAPQGRGDNNRRAQSVGIAVLASLLVLRRCHHAMVPGKPWRIFQLQHALRLRVMTNPVAQKVQGKMAKACNAA